ncbi:class A basic helix-loop-helix protein 15-like [Palaemon carinicauda]|uniref:class A basic helix-loop-helix protein 15-like n=1 Tax=Palaemon carinicauda TaxID=392227 RepID=UPI0035B5FBCE
MIVRQDTKVENVSSRTNPSMKYSDSGSGKDERGTTDGVQLRSSAGAAKKYGLRPRNVIRRVQAEKRREDEPGRVSKASRVRPAPLSKYRRKTANARERQRMKEINNAFETLRRILPDFCRRREASSMTKITTLKLAVSYIRTLSHILEGGRPSDISFLDGFHLEEPSVCSPDPANQRYFKPDHLRTSPGSVSDLSDLLPDEESCDFDDNLSAFDDIQALPEMDAFSLLMVKDADSSSTGS